MIAAGAVLKLSPTELRLLHALMRQPGRVLSRAALLPAVCTGDGAALERTIDVHVRRLRLALHPSGLHRLVKTVRGAGYRFGSD